MILDPAATWSLHPQLAADTLGVGDLPLSRVLISLDANYPWLILAPRRPGLVEILDLDETARVQLMEEIAGVAGALKQVTACDKLNIAALGNVVPQLHVHVVARRKNDPAWPAPVWGRVAPRPYDQAKLDRFVAALGKKLGLDGDC
ncbi:MAG: HIT family protein [Xanthobacteraceae bacterium]